MLAQLLAEHLPQTLRVPYAPVPGQAHVKLEFRAFNPTEGTLWFRFRTRPFLFTLTPNPLSLAPQMGETVVVDIDAGKIHKDNYKTLEIIAAWSVLETDAETGKASTRNGEQIIKIEMPEPRRPMACPDPECAQLILTGDTVCKYCQALLRYCPECNAPAVRTASVCTSLAKHTLPRQPDWPVAGGNAARIGASPLVVEPSASLAWRYAPASPKADTAIEWTSPAIAYDMVFIAGAVAGHWSRLVALDLLTGAEIWQLALPENDPVYPYRGGPSVSSGLVFVATLTGYLLAVDAARGKRRWAARVPHQVYGGCLAAGNALFVGTVHPNDEGGHLLALWPEDGEIVWKLGVEGHLDTNLAAHKGHIYACGDDGHLYAVNAAKGEVVWRQPTDGPFDGGPLVAESTVFCATSAGDLFAFASEDGQLQWRVPMGAAAEAPPAVHAGKVYCGTADGTMHCFSSEGKRIGSASVGSQMRSAPVPTANGVIFGAEDGGLHFTDAIRQVKPLYQLDPGTRLSCPLAISGRRVVTAATDGVVYAVDVEVEA